MKNLLRSALIALVMSAPTAVQADQIADAVLATATQLRKQLPMRVDEKTTVVAVVAAGRKLKYSYRFDFAKNELPLDWETQQTKVLRYNVCNHSAMRKMMKIGVLYSYLYTDINGYFIADITVKNSDC